MKLTSLLQLVNKLQQVGKIDNLQQVCGVSGCAVLQRNHFDVELLGLWISNPYPFRLKILAASLHPILGPSSEVLLLLRLAVCRYR